MVDVYDMLQTTDVQLYCNVRCTYVRVVHVLYTTLEGTPEGINTVVQRVHNLEIFEI
jgi:hypothetical protein